MQIRVFNVPVFATEAEQDELNRFLRGHRVLEVKQEYDAQRGMWTFAVNYMDGQKTPMQFGESARQEKVDYRTVLSPEAFERF